MSVKTTVTTFRVSRGWPGSGSLGGCDFLGILGERRLWVDLQVERGILDQDRALEPGECRTRLDAELLEQRSLRGLERVERLGLAPRSVQREHEKTPETLAVGVLGDQGLELADEMRVPTEREVCIDPVFDGDEPELLESGDLGTREVLEREVGERRPGPELERGAKEVGGASRVARGTRCLRRRRQLLKPIEVELARLGPQQIAGRVRDDDLPGVARRPSRLERRSKA